jgi:GNAT superfamily N-acetyltransferase
MAADIPVYKARELSTRTWPDFVKLFSPESGWQHCWCVHFHRPHALPRSEWLPRRAERSVRNRREQKRLVDEGCSHGILVYEKGEPVGWCQYGRREELTRIDNNRNYREPMAEGGSRKLWRITCFVVEKKHRRRGVAGAALKAALASIKKQGGGLVEGYPVADWEGKSFGNMSTHGTASMFKKAGFKAVGPFGSTNMIMRRTI